MDQREEIEEERRLLYVARAKNSLHLITYALYSGQHPRLLRERRMAAAFRRAHRAQPEVRIDLKSRMRGMC